MINIEYRYKNQSKCFSYKMCKNIDEVIDWVNRFKNKQLEDHTEVDSIEEFNIIFENNNFVNWIKVHRKSFIHWNEFDIIIFVNDYPIGTLFEYNDINAFLKSYIKNREILKSES